MPEHNRSKSNGANRGKSNGVNLGFEAGLWRAADALRSNMDAAEYKHIVLGLIVLKYISDTFEEQYAKLQSEQSERADPEDPDEYWAVDVFWVPKAARWSHLKANAKQPTIGKIIDDAMLAIERDNPSLKGVLPKDYAHPRLDKQLEPIVSASERTRIPHAKWEYAASLELPLPPLPEQRAIAHILGTLDDKIELNRRMSETLEQMARALFKAWFVDFELVRAKMEGRWRRGDDVGATHASPLRGLPAHLYDLFPDQLVDSKLGEIPEEWGVGCADDEFDLTMGQSPPGDNEAEEGLPFYQGRANFGFRFPTRCVDCTAPTRLAKTGDTLISVRAPVGDITMASGDCAIGRGVAAARHKTGSRSYSYRFMCSLKEVFARFEAEGTVCGSIGKKDFHAIPCVMPPRNLIVEFERRISPFDGRIEVNERESRTFAALRDALLPKLISGELRMKDVERFLEEREL